MAYLITKLALAVKKRRPQISDVEWIGQIFMRRSSNNKFDAVVWLSRCIAKDSEGCYLKRRMAVTF
jgi:hypothetical protein